MLIKRQQEREENIKIMIKLARDGKLGGERFYGDCNLNGMLI